MTREKSNLDSDLSSVALATSRAESFDYLYARKALSSWFDAHGRVFPWREDPTPYRVWISEMMLQQTTTQTVLGYFERFLARFPDPTSLANASEEEVLALWEGLGYYRRARALHKAAAMMVARFHGEVPNRYDDVLSLPGVGKYCAGAILSFGYDKRYPILEANTTRLHARLVALDATPTLASSQKLLWRVALDWLPDESPSRKKNLYRRLNSALMDLGRLICQPAEPKCDACPLASFCEAYRSGTQNILPLTPKKEAPIPRTDVAFWIERADLGSTSLEVQETSHASPTDVLLLRYPTYSLWAGLWDFPRFEVVDPAFRDAQKWRRDPELADRLALFLEREVGALAKRYWPGPALKTLRHAVTRYRIRLSLVRLEDAVFLNGKTQYDGMLFDLSPLAPIPSDPDRLSPSAPTKRLEGKPLAAEIRWVPVAELPRYPLSSTGRKLAKFIMESHKGA